MVRELGDSNSSKSQLVATGAHRVGHFSTHFFRSEDSWDADPTLCKLKVPFSTKQGTFGIVAETLGNPK